MPERRAVRAAPEERAEAPGRRAAPPGAVREVASGGVRLVCRDRGGRGPGLLMLHGLAGHGGEWDDVARSLADEHRVVTLDQRGHGASARRAADRQVDASRAAYTADVATVVRELGLAPVVLVGQSLGGHTAMLAAAAHPELVRALVLVEAGPGGGRPGLPEEIRSWLDSWPAPFPSPEAAAEFFGGGPAGRGWADGLERRDGGWRPRFDPAFMVASVEEVSRRTYWDEWERVSCPVLVILAESGIVGPEESRKMRRRAPGARFVVIPDAGHDVHLEEPGRVAAAVRDFLTTC
ncbi:alpha/beta fold hydrolase [Bailinhaonella thermotolerans]|uniref:Alpha/beta hydrolase n=1 Tax=Bailinhaonella thermotolerans TaxID=1070861 RepID=A0A3A4APF5_9ACTN|nr:alpha/beta hydrolase [Bailinhaonella thermotolerans]RJL30439.1 alpha/beta hydrolase [Bailinhaonella thermotolerans]